MPCRFRPIELLALCGRTVAVHLPDIASKPAFSLTHAGQSRLGLLRTKSGANHEDQICRNERLSHQDGVRRRSRLGQHRSDAGLTRENVRKEELVRFNKDQREGIAKVSDNLATACMVAAIVGGFVDHKIGWGTVLPLVVTAAVLVFIGIVMRKDAGHGN